VIASEGSGERWISVDFSRKGSPAERYTEMRASYRERSRKR